MLPIIREIAEQLSQSPVVESVILYGSRARGTHRERSDIDLAVVCPKATSCDWFDLTDVVDEARTLLKIDLVRYGRLPAEFKEEIDQEGIVLYDRRRKDQTIYV